MGDFSEVNGLEKVEKCPFCQSSHASSGYSGVQDYFFRADPGEFEYVRCQVCGSLWLEYRPIGERLLNAYASYHTHAQPQPHSTRKGVRKALSSLYIRSRYARPAGLLDGLAIKVARAILPDRHGIDRKFRFAPPAPAKLLDYGCGSGEYLLWMAPLGHSLVGVEYDPHLLAAVAERGIQIEDVMTIDQQDWGCAFDHITIAHVLEHVPDPVDLLRRLFAYLKPGGTLFIEVPNGGASGLDIFGRYWRGLEAPRHFSLPSHAAMTGALVDAGFMIERQPVDRSTRRWMWEESLGVCPTSDRPALCAAMDAAPPETLTNAEFLTFLARKPD
jgi:2-polyprenyl-3-methyl-5-hydroxy-6-metoxy-1,4-benzoquinol methylase